MATGVPLRNTSAFNPDAIRREIRSAAAVPAGMLRKALRKHYEKLDAKETKFFTYQGQVIDKVDVEAHDIQLRAAELIERMAELYVNEARSAPRQSVALEIDPNTGVVRIVVGDPPPPPVIVEAELAAAPQKVLDASNEDASCDPDAPQQQDNEVIHVRKPRGVLDPDLKKILFGDAPASAANIPKE